MRVPFCDLPRQYRDLRAELDAAVLGVLARGDFILGEDVQRFEAEFAAFCGASHCVGVASGTDALHLMLRALGIGPGDEVVTVANTFAAVSPIGRPVAGSPRVCRRRSAVWAACR